MKKILIILAVVCGIGPISTNASQITIDPTSALEIRFHMPDVDFVITPDLLFLGLNNLSINAPVISHTAQLFNANVLLGTVSNTLGGNRIGDANLEAGAWRTSDSSYRGGPGRSTVIDFSSVIDKTIDGRIIFSIESGSFLFDDDPIINPPGGSCTGSAGSPISDPCIFLRVGEGVGPGGFRSRPEDNPIVTSVSRISLVPEPTTLVLVGLGLAGIGYRMHRSKNTA